MTETIRYADYVEQVTSNPKKMKTINPKLWDYMVKGVGEYKVNIDEWGDSDIQIMLNFEKYNGKIFEYDSKVGPLSALYGLESMYIVSGTGYNKGPVDEEETDKRIGVTDDDHHKLQDLIGIHLFCNGMLHLFSDKENQVDFGVRLIEVGISSDEQEAEKVIKMFIQKLNKYKL